MEKKKKITFWAHEKAFDRVPRKVFKLAMMKKGIPEVLVRSAMNLHEGTNTGVRLDSELLEEFMVNWRGI